MSKNVVVLMGGWSSEREVSLSSGRGCAEALERAGYRVTAIDVTRDLSALLAELDRAKPDAVFNALHGRFGEDGCMQGLLDMLGIPYTHSGRLASALAMDKLASRRLFEEAELPLAPGRVVRRADLTPADEPSRPYVVKPINEGSSVGVTLVFEDDATPLFADDWAFGELVVIEEYIPGREIQVAVMGGKSLGTIEIRTERRFYDYVAKYTPGASEHLVPAPIVPEAHEQVMEIARMAHLCLGCRGVTRVDLRYDDTAGEPGRFALLEVNTQPGMTPTSLVPEIAAHAGISFEDLVSWMVENAACDC
ncbi:MAG: D-alanine--D-alanine ligase [Alphaproteobacteria bacterium]|nr:D-alanine--D-alanine ligase [Alphaproteobacteria bacterium]